MEDTKTPWDETDPGVIEQVWNQRAEHLAQPPVVEDQGERIDLVVVQLGSEYFGLEARYVNAIRDVGLVTPVPRVPDWVMGVVNLRGRILSLIDLSRFYNIPEKEMAAELNPSMDFREWPSIMVVDAPGIEVALYVKRIITVEAFATSQIHDAGDILPRFPKGSVSGILFSPIRGSNEDLAMVIIVNVPALLGDKRLIVNEEFI